MLPFARLTLVKTIPLSCSNRAPFRTLTTLATDHLSNTRTGSNDDYFATIHHISNIVRRDIYLERTLNKMCLSRIVNSELVYRVLRSCCNSGIESFRFFNWVRTQHPQYEPTTVEFEELLKILAKTRHWETMWKVAHQMKTQKLPISASVVSFIIEHYGKNGLIDQAVELFNKCKNFNCLQTTEIYNSLLFALCEVKNFQGAYGLVRRMVRKGVVPDKKTYSVLVNGWCSAGKMKEAQSFLEEMSRKGFNPPVRGRDLLIDGLLNAGYLESAKGMVRKMTKEGFVPDVSTFNSLAEAICQSGEIDFCIGLYHDVCRLGLCPDIETYKIMIAASSKIGRIDGAFSILYRSIEDGNKPFPSLYAPILKGLFRNGLFDDAFSFFSDMKVKGHPPNRPVYTMLIKMCARGGRYVEAANCLMEMTEFKLSPMSRHFDMVTDGLKNCGKHDMAKRIEQLEITLRAQVNRILEDGTGTTNSNLVNCLWEYTNAVMNFLYGPQNLDGSSSLTLDWLQYFDVEITGSAKPNFFHEENHSNLFAWTLIRECLLILIMVVRWLRLMRGSASELPNQIPDKPYKVFRGGNVGHLHKLLSIKSSSQVLYVGDHIYGEILRSKKVLGWRTMLVIPELEKEVKLLWNLRDTRKQLKLLRRERSQIEDQIHLLKWSLQCASLDAHETEKVSSKLGLLELQLERVRVTHQEAQKRFHEKVERFACLYTSQVGNLGLHSPAKYYRPDEDFMPHEYDVHSL